MKIDAPTRGDVRHVAELMRTQDVTEFLAVSPAGIETQADLVEALVNRYGGAPDAIGVYLGVVPVAIGAMVQHRPNVATLMFFATDDFPQVAAALTRFIVQRLFPQYRAGGVHRIECVSNAEYTQAHRWIGALGLKREAVLPGYGRGMETFIQFAWVSDACQTSD